MRTSPRQTDRRGFLRGLGVTMALPLMESLMPTRALAAAGDAAPVARSAFFYVPNGVIEDAWRPSGEGRDFQLGASLAPVERFKSELQIISKLAQESGRAGRDGAGDHARALATYLTSVRAKKTAGADIHLGRSIDQAIAQSIGARTRLPSLELSTDASRKSGRCDSGYSCAYQFNLSWADETRPVAAEVNPRNVFDRLFGAGPRAEQARTSSILDFVMEDAQSLHRRLGNNDKQKLDEYLTGVRDIESQIQQAETIGGPAKAPLAEPSGVPEGFQDYIRVMCDLMVAAFQTDTTRVSAFCLSHDGNNRRFPELGINDAHHNLSHHRRKEDAMAKLRKIDRFYSEQLAYVLEKMKSTKDLQGRPLLDTTMISWGSGLSDADRHDHYDLPTVLAGGRGLGLDTGRYLKLKDDTPLADLQLAIARKMGVDLDRHGDSEGALAI